MTSENSVKLFCYLKINMYQSVFHWEAKVLNSKVFQTFEVKSIKLKHSVIESLFQNIDCFSIPDFIVSIIV